MAKTPTDFIAERGGPTAVARATGNKPNTVDLWRHRNKIPRSAWPEIMEAFPDVSISDLKDIEQRSGREAA
jgi:hypothetical protein